MNLFASPVFVHNIVAIVMIIVVLVVGVFYIRDLSRCLQLISPKNRALPPWSVWLLPVPIFSFLWNYVLIFKIAKSLHSENLQRNIKIQKIQTGRDIGIIYVTVTLLCMFVPEQKTFLGLFAGMCWIGHWIILRQQINELRLAASSIPSMEEVERSSLS